MRVRGIAFCVKPASEAPCDISKGLISKKETALMSITFAVEKVKSNLLVLCIGNALLEHIDVFLCLSDVGLNGLR